ncbi:unnamed protein product [Toxocara canis]|uniref:G_PROTEIN_RECEP_F1_2 domain-containing protein n=1 Tax=Toxocara canis TaxID=6265 RepID=A0A183UHB9_TOXCA|nr:unnamed protein product [Toxocara canis]
MLPDALLVLLPSVGFVQCAASIFILIVFVKVKKEAYAFLGGLAIAADERTRENMEVSMSAIALQEIKRIQCLIRGLFITIWVQSDAAQVIFLIAASLDGFLAVLVPVEYVKTSSHCHGMIMIMVLLMVSALSAVPMWVSAVTEQSSNNSVSALCPLPEGDGVVGVMRLENRSLSTKLPNKRKFSWSKTIKKFQRFICIMLRAILCILSVNLPLLTAANKPVTSSLYVNRDVISRIIYGISVCICQPAIYFAVLGIFREDVIFLLKRYSHNTKRQWVSADDPPVEVDHDIAGTATQFGSWYSSAGNIIGEAGMPSAESSNKERSISFYNDSAVNTNNPSTSNAYRMSAMKNANKQTQK